MRKIAALRLLGVASVLVVATGLIGCSNGGVSLAVNKTPLTVTANNQTMTYGMRPPALTVSYSGFVNGDTVATLSGSPTLTAAVTSFTPAGSYPITVAAGTLSATNYTFNFVNGALTVNPAPLVVPDRGNNRVLIYNPPFSNGQIAGVVLGQTGFTSAAAATTQAGMWFPGAVTFDMPVIYTSLRA
jgi:hypothetical protein